MRIDSHAHVIRFGDMMRCTVCHRSWQMDETDADVPTCEPVEEVYRDTKPERKTKHEGWCGPGDHGKTRIKTRPSLRR